MRFALTPVLSSWMTLLQVLTSHDLSHGQAESGTQCTLALLAQCKVNIVMQLGILIYKIKKKEKWLYYV